MLQYTRKAVMQNRISSTNYKKTKQLDTDIEPILTYCNWSYSKKYHLKQNVCPTNLDICEMCCDWTAHCDRDKEQDNTKYFRENLIEQFDFCKEKRNDFLEILNLLNSFRK